MKIRNRDDWLYERYSEFRKLIKVLLNQIEQGSFATVVGTQANATRLDWFDTMLTLNNLVSTFNLALSPET